DDGLARAAEAIAALAEATERRRAHDDPGERAALERAVAARPDWPEGWHFLGRRLLLLQQHADALAHLDRAVALGPSPWALEDRARARLGLNDLVGAVEDLGRCLEMIPDAHGLRVERAQVLQQTGAADLALAELDECLRRAPEHPGALTLRGRIRLTRGDAAGGIADLEQATRAGRDPLPWYLLAQARESIGDDRGALEALDGAAAAGGARDLHHLRAEVLLRRGDVDGALRALDQAVAEVPTEPDPLLRRARLLLLAGGDPARAAADAARALEVRGRTVTVLALVLRSEARLRQGDAEEALADADAAVTIAPAEPEARLARGLAWAALGNLPAAADDLRRFLAGAPPDHPRAAEARALLARLAR
ncbi:MAG: tetratricopeptide repeat protein, partial [Planctomycetes bacterium]|nr:tetratricopeptide repeat protein [Planctomycetota bacterium]